MPSLSESSLPCLKPARIPRGSRILILGDEESGKTTLVKDLIRRRNLRDGYVHTCSPAEWELDNMVTLLSLRENIVKEKFLRLIPHHNFVVLEDRVDIREISNEIILNDSIKDLILIRTPLEYFDNIGMGLQWCDYIFLGKHSNPDLKPILWNFTGCYFKQEDIREYEFLVLGVGRGDQGCYQYKVEMQLKPGINH